MSPDRKLLHRVDLSTKRESVNSLEGRYPGILQHISQETGFVSSYLTPFHISRWWNTETIGAVIFDGTYKGRNAAVKIEAVKISPDEITETSMIRYTKSALVESGIRPPEIFQELPWSDTMGGYSAVIMEQVEGVPILPVPGTREQIAQLLTIRDRYRQALQNNHVEAWIAKEGTLADTVAAKFSSWRKSSYDLFPNHPFRKPGDRALVDKAVAALQEGYKDVDAEFMQGHFSHRDVVQVGDDIVMFSNLYWSYRAPFYDVVFPYHWYMLEVAGHPVTISDSLHQQQMYWMDEFTRRELTMTLEEKKLFRLARIERLAAAINMDALSVSSDGTNGNVGEIMDMMRNDLQTLLAA